jgi:hypothetical protein
LKIKVFCAYHELVKVSDLKPNPMNPNRHSIFQIELLAKIIAEAGFRDPITVSKRSGFVVRGHGRLEAAKSLRMKKVPVDFQEYQSEADELADLVADNKIQEMSWLDDGKLKEIFEKIDIRSRAVFAGFTDDEIMRIMENPAKIFEDFASEPGSDETDHAPAPAGDGATGPASEEESPEKYLRLQIEMSAAVRDEIIGAVGDYAARNGINISSDAFVEICRKWRESR